MRDVPDVSPGPGEVVVAVAAAGVNFPDVLTIADKYQVSTPLPFTPGSEFAGRVSALGEGVTGLSVGEEVMGSAIAGAFAEQVVAPAASLSPVPAGLDMVHAAAFRVAYATAYHSLVTFGGLEPDQWVVVLGAAGGVGTAAVDIAARMGARVVAAASSAERLAVCARLGAAAGVDYSCEDLKLRVKEITGTGADLVIDPVGGRYSEQALRAIRWGGCFVCVGFAAGDIPRIPLNLVLLKNVVVRGMEIRSLQANLPHAVKAAERDLAALVADGMRPMVSQVFDLTDTATALSRVADRQATGKIVIRISD